MMTPLFLIAVLALAPAALHDHPLADITIRALQQASPPPQHPPGAKDDTAPPKTFTLPPDARKALAARAPSQLIAAQHTRAATATPSLPLPPANPPGEAAPTGAAPPETEPARLPIWLMLLGVLLLWWLIVSLARIAFCIVGRACGFAAPEHAAVFLKVAIVPVLWRPVYEHFVYPFLWWLRQVRNKTGATSGWLPLPAVLTNVFRRGDSVPLGRLVWKNIKLWQTISYRGPLHVNVIGPSGSGKTATFISWLGTLHRKAAAFFVDCDAQIINADGDWLVKTGHKVISMDPNNLSKKFKRGCYNVLDELTAAEKRHGRAIVPNFAKALGEALVRQENHHQPTFDNGGRDFIVALCLFVWLTAPSEKRNLVYMRHLLCCGLPGRTPKENPFDVLLFEMSEMQYKDDGCGGRIGALIARGAATMKSGQNRDGGNPFHGSAMRATSWLDLPCLAEMSERGDFVFEELKTSNTCVAIVAPLTDIKGTYSGWVRAMSVMCAYAFQNIPGRLKIPAAMLIDEAPSLGRLELLEVGSPGFRKYGIRLVVGMQDIPSISAKTAYPDTYETLFSNAGVNLWMGTSDLRTQRHVSDTLGKHTRREKVEGTPWYLFWLPRRFRIAARYQNFERLLKDPEQVKDLLSPDRGMMIVTGKTRPFVAAVDPYWKALPVTRYNPDPNYAETWLRARMRQFLAWWAARRSAGATRAEQ